MIDITTDPDRIDVRAVHDFLSLESSWAQGISLERVQRALSNSLCFAAIENDQQIGFARVITDRATYAYLCDVYVRTDQRGRGISRLLMDAVMAHPDLQGLRRFMLATSTARGLYEKYGWTSPVMPQSLMERYFPDIYQQQV